MGQNYINPATGRLNKNCLDCGKKVSRLGTKRCRICNGKQQSIRQLGKNNPYYRHGKTGNTFCSSCGVKVRAYTATMCRACKGKQTSIRQKGINNPMYKDGRHANNMTANCIDCGQEIWSCNTRCRTCWDMYNIGERNPSWKGGISFEPYAVGWSRRLKESVRKRDNYTCQECGKPQAECLEKLCVHHIDYNKQNLDIKNLISLCRSCHSNLAGRPAWAEPKYKEHVCNLVP